MLDPTELYQIVDDEGAARGTAEAEDAAGRRFPVLVHHLQGYIDAGHAGRLATEHLMATFPATEVATFDVDQLLDYRARRPIMTYERDHWADYDTPKLALYALEDVSGAPFLLLTGPEPDTQWERFTSAVIKLVEHFGVELTVGLNAIPMAVPHTRPAGVTAHATRRELIDEHEQWTTVAQLPGSAAALLELRLGQAGHDAMGLAVHVPHYLSETEYPQAAGSLLDHLAASADLAVPTDALVLAAVDVSADIAAKVADSEQAIKVVEALERRYDDEVSSQGRTSLLAEDQAVPTADEIGAEIERFLSEQDSETG
jgi:predicted ATP-grasp superfamily ATP-dependent carboligase